MPELDGVEHRWVEAGGLRMHVAEAGQGEPLVLLHGWPQHWWCWRKLIPPLAERYRVIAPDLRGYGWSDAPPRGYEKEQFADDVAALLDALELEQVRLVGHDWGGMAGFILCLKRPDLVRRYIALNTGHVWGRADLQSLPQMWRFWYAGLMATPFLGSRVAAGFKPFHDLLGRQLGLTPKGWSERDAEIFLSQFSEPERSHVSTQTYRSFLTHDLIEGARGRWEDQRLRVPTLFLHGADDGVIHPSFLRGFEEHADDGRLEMVPDCGHFIAEECPELVLERALEFFR